MNTLLHPSPHLLVADDDEDIRTLMADLLADEGYRVSLASSAAEAQAQVNEQLFQGVLTDLFASSQVDPWRSVMPLFRAARPIPVGVVTAWNISPEVLLRMALPSPS